MGGRRDAGRGSAAVNERARAGVVRLAQLAVGALLAWAALAKIGDVHALAGQIRRFALLPPGSENLLAIVLPWIELTAAASLLLGLRARAGAAVATGLLLIFTVAVGLAMARGLDVACGCFGSTDAARADGTKLAMNLGMLALAALGTRRARAPMSEA